MLSVARTLLINIILPTYLSFHLTLRLNIKKYTAKYVNYSIWRCMHRASSYNKYINQQDAQNSCD